MNFPSPRPTMLAVCALPDEVLDDFRKAFDLTLQPLTGALVLEQIEPALRGRQIILTSATTKFPAGLLSALPESVKAIATYSVGLDHLDLAAARSRGIAVFNTPDVLTQSVADATLLLILGAARRATESISLIRSRTWTGWTACQLNGLELANKTLGIYGMGRIGQAIAVRARGFGLSIHYHNRTRLAADTEGEARFHPVADDMLAQCDVLVLASPSTAETRGFLNAARIARMRPGSMVVNVGRGDLVDDDALIAALGCGHIYAAGLDVFNNEPRVDERYFDLPNVFMLPHIGSSTIEARRRMGALLIQGLMDWREGRAAANRVA